MTDKKNKKHSAECKITLLKRHLVDGISVSELCDKHNIAPSLFYKWQQELFAQGTLVFESSKKNKKIATKHEEKISLLEKKLTQKNEVLSELMEEHLKLKKNIGDL